MPKYTIRYTHFVEVEWGAFKEIEADNIEEAEKIAIEAGKNSDFDDTDESSNPDPIRANGRCVIYDGHIGWDLPDNDEYAMGDIEYDSET
tara:strand:- start:2912 stop:3181 length:270 start_codon:yes stop_codon:yes gene_type:complete